MTTLRENGLSISVIGLCVSISSPSGSVLRHRLGHTRLRGFSKTFPFNHEILDFAVQSWRRAPVEGIRERLIAILRGTQKEGASGRIGGNVLTLLYRLDRQLPRDMDWTGQVFDGADLEEADLSGFDFKRSWFRYANLANANFEHADFRECDLTRVRIEETAPVTALGPGSSGDRLIAAYRDGVLREWDIGQGERSAKLAWKELAQMGVDTPAAIGIHESGQAWTRTSSESIFFEIRRDGTWAEVSRFAMKGSLQVPRPHGDQLSVVHRSTEGGARATAIDLSGPKMVCSIRTNGARHCACLGAEGLVWSDSTVGFRLARTRQNGTPFDIVLACPEPTCLDVRKIEEGIYVVAGGGGNGRVRVWEVSQHTSEWSHRQVLDFESHRGPVTAVTVLRAESG